MRIPSRVVVGTCTCKLCVGVCTCRATCECDSVHSCMDTYTYMCNSCGCVVNVGDAMAAC